MRATLVYERSNASNRSMRQIMAPYSHHFRYLADNYVSRTFNALKHHQAQATNTRDMRTRD